MFFKYSINFYLFWFWIICRRIQKLLYYSAIKLIYNTPNTKEQTDQEKINSYHEKQKNYMLSFSRPSKNISYYFYDELRFKNISMEEMERIKGYWKQRILIEPLPNHPSSIIMFYNPEKLAFSYYSDTIISSYNLLNAVAMKYTTLFFCQDFFVDESITDKSRLLNILREEFIFDPNQKNNQSESIKKEPNEALRIIQENNSLFKKLKVNINTSNRIRELNEDKQVQDVIKCKNRFVYLGRVRDFNPLKNQQPKKKIKTLFPEITEHDEPTETDKSVFMGSSIGWKTYKEKMKINKNSTKSQDDEPTESENSVFMKSSFR